MRRPVVGRDPGLLKDPPARDYLRVARCTRTLRTYPHAANATQLQFG